MRKSSDGNEDRRPILPPIWDLFGDELSGHSKGYNYQASSSSVHTLPSGQDRRYDRWVANHLAHQDRPPSDLGHGHSRENPAFIHQVLDAPGPTFHQAIPYSSPQDAQWHDLGTNPIPPYRASAPTPSTNRLPSNFDSLSYHGQSPQTTRLPISSDEQAADDESTLGPSYNTFRLFYPSSQPHEESGRYECQYCGKAFQRPSTLRIHLNSHTGEKPFLCPVEGCGRSFSVLSNMRRHARVHPTTPEATAQSSGEGTSFFDHRQIGLAASSSMASPQNYSNSFEDNIDEDNGSDHLR